MFVPKELFLGCLAVECSPSAKLTLLELVPLSFDNKVSVNALDKVSLSRNTRYKAVRELLNSGYLQKDKRHYCFNIPLIDSWLNVEAVKEVFQLKASTNIKLALFGLCRFLNTELKCFPKMSTLSNLLRLSVRSIQRAFHVLKQKGILNKVKQGGKWIMSVTFCTKSVTPKKQDCTKSVTSVVPNLSPSKKVFENGKQKKTGQKATIPALSVKKQEGGINRTPPYPPKGVVHLAKGGSVQKVIKDVQNKPKSIKETCFGLSLLWRSTVPQIYDTGIISLTQKEVVMFKRFLTASTEKQVKASEALEFILTHWTECVAFVAKAKGLVNTPSLPAVAWTVRHVDTLITYFLQNKEGCGKNIEKKILTKANAKFEALLSGDK